MLGLYPWSSNETFDAKVRHFETQEQVAIIRKQWSYFCKEKCSNGGNWFVKFKDPKLPWNYKALTLEALIMIDMMEFNGRFVCRMEVLFLAFIGGIALTIFVIYSIMMGALWSGV